MTDEEFIAAAKKAARSADADMHGRLEPGTPVADREALLEQVLRDAIDFIAELQRNGCPPGPVAIPFRIKHVLE